MANRFGLTARVSLKCGICNKDYMSSIKNMMRRDLRKGHCFECSRQRAHNNMTKWFKRQAKARAIIQAKLLKKISGLFVAALILIACGSERPKASSYVNDIPSLSREAESYFNPKYEGEIEHWEEFVSLSFLAEREDVERACHAQALGCTNGFDIVVWDSPDTYQRCTIILHELGHVGAELYGSKDGDPNHTENPEYFYSFVSDTCWKLSRN